MDIRQLRNDEFDASTALSEYAFQYTMTPEQKEASRANFKPEQYWGIFDEEELQAKLTILPLRIYLQGRKLDMGGIAGVATWPENRRQGHVTILLKHALQEMKDYGQSVSFLHPFSIPFYRKFGWELYAEYKKYIIPVSKFPAKLESPGRVIRDVKDISILDTMYEAYASQYNGTLIRDESWWSQSVLRQNGFNAVYYSADGVPQGYVLYELKDSELVCREFVYLNEEARGALWTFFANHDSRIERVVLTMVPSDDELPFMLKDPRFTQEKVPYFMARIVDLKAFISQYTFEVNRQMELTIRVEDSAAPWNNGQWLLAINEAGGANIEKLADSEEGVSDLTTDIQTLSALFMGYKRPKALYRMQRILGDTAKVDQLESAVPDGQTHLMDFF